MDATVKNTKLVENIVAVLIFATAIIPYLYVFSSSLSTVMIELMSELILLLLLIVIYNRIVRPTTFWSWWKKLSVILILLQIYMVAGVSYSPYILADIGSAVCWR